MKKKSFCFAFFFSASVSIVSIVIAHMIISNDTSFIYNDEGHIAEDMLEFGSFDKEEVESDHEELTAEDNFQEVAPTATSDEVKIEDAAYPAEVAGVADKEEVEAATEVKVALKEKDPIAEDESKKIAPFAVKEEEEAEADVSQIQMTIEMVGQDGESEQPIQVHNPRNFSDKIQLNIDRGLNIINMQSGQKMASWIYISTRRPQKNRHIAQKDPVKKFLTHPEQAAKMQDNDTVYVSFYNMDRFTFEFLPKINTTFVLITTRNDGNNIHPDHSLYAPNITSHPKLLQWFAGNIQITTGGFEYHPLVSPFPLGLKPHFGRSPSRNPVPYFRKAFLFNWYKYKKNETYFQLNKEHGIFAGYIAQIHKSRENITSGKSLPYVEYLEMIAKSRYVLSPDGILPDCHRHYESIGLGAIPITQLNPYMYSHFEEGSVIYNNTNWNVTALNSLLPNDPTTHKNINRNVIFEEYWMEYVERVVQRPLRWWDVLQNQQVVLADFAFNSTLAEVAMKKDLEGWPSNIE